MQGHHGWTQRGCRRNRSGKPPMDTNTADFADSADRKKNPPDGRYDLDWFGFRVSDFFRPSAFGFRAWPAQGLLECTRSCGCPWHGFMGGATPQAHAHLHPCAMRAATSSSHLAKGYRQWTVTACHRLGGVHHAWDYERGAIVTNSGFRQAVA